MRHNKKNCISLDTLKVSKNRVDYFFSVSDNLQSYFQPNNHLFFEYNHDISEIPESILAIPFVANVIPLIWITDSTILVKELDKSFFECLDKIKGAYQNMYHNVDFEGSVVVNKLVENTYLAERQAACLFSGGLDSLAMFVKRKDLNPLLITACGWPKENIQQTEMCEEDKKHVLSFAARFGLKNIIIQSNFRSFISGENINLDYQRKLGINWWSGLHHSLAFISSAIPTAFEMKVQCIYIASSFYQGYKAKCASDPTIDNQVKYASGIVFHDVYELTRQDKIKVVVEHFSQCNEPVSLRVCFQTKENCCNCEKCWRTILGIIAEGKNPQDFGFNVPESLLPNIKNFLKENIKFFTGSKIMQWNQIKQRMAANSQVTGNKDLINWFLCYDFKSEQRKALLTYRVTKFLPILERRIKTQVNRMVAKIKAPMGESKVR